MLGATAANCRRSGAGAQGLASMMVSPRPPGTSHNDHTQGKHQVLPPKQTSKTARDKTETPGNDMPVLLFI